MKKILMIAMAGVLALGLLVACGGAASAPSSTPTVTSSAPESQPEQQQEEPMIYRGRVDEVTDEMVTVTQMEGHNYGQPSIQFHIDENTVVQDGGLTLAAGDFVQVNYSGVLTRSLPAQGTASEIIVIASFSDGVLVNGTIQEATKTDTGYTLQILPFATEDSADSSSVASSASVEGASSLEEAAPGFENYIIVSVELEALEGLTEEDLVAGTEVCAVTTGIAALSLPPQMSAIALLPYTTV